jgi:hypothetical protein
MLQVTISCITHLSEEYVYIPEFTNYLIENMEEGSMKLKDIRPQSLLVLNEGFETNLFSITNLI